MQIKSLASRYAVNFLQLHSENHFSTIESRPEIKIRNFYSEKLIMHSFTRKSLDVCQGRAFTNRSVKLISIAHWQLCITLRFKSRIKPLIKWLATSITDRSMHYIAAVKRSRVTAEEVIHNEFQDHSTNGDEPSAHSACDETRNQL